MPQNRSFQSKLAQVRNEQRRLVTAFVSAKRIRTAGLVTVFFSLLGAVLLPFGGLLWLLLGPTGALAFIIAATKISSIEPRLDELRIEVAELRASFIEISN